jgi:N-formylglutamate amidohydrolase
MNDGITHPITDDDRRREFLRAADIATLKLFELATQDGDTVLEYPVGREPNLDDLHPGDFSPYQSRLATLVSEEIDRAGQSLIVDCHSFSCVNSPYHSYSYAASPDFCLAYESFHAPSALWSTARSALHSKGYTVELNHPYRMSLVPNIYYKCDSRVTSILVAVNHKLYMNEETGELTANFVQVRSHITSTIQAIRDYKSAQQHLFASR